MRIVTVDAVSANGKLTRGDDTPSHIWTSAEDWAHFQEELQDLIIEPEDDMFYLMLKNAPWQKGKRW